MNAALSSLTLSDVCEAIVDCEHKTAPIQESGFPSIRTPNIGRGSLILHGVNRVSEKTYKLWTQRMEPQPGDLILAREAPVGNVAIIPKGMKVCLGQRTVLIRPDREKVLPRYLVYMMLGDEIQGRIQSLSNGATVHHLNMKDIRGLRLPKLPCMAHQRRIASILSAYDDLIENNARRIAILEEMARRIYEEWFVHFRFPGHEKVRMVESELGLVPEGWRCETLEDCAFVTMGQSPRSEFYNEIGAGLPFHQGVTNFGRHFPKHKTFCTANGRFAEEGDILVSVRAPVGRINLSPCRMVIGRGLCAVRSKSRRQIFLLHRLLYVFKEEDSMGNGAIFKAVSKQEMLSIKFCVPDRDLISKFETAAEPLWLLIRNLTDTNTKLRTTRDLLLPKLISGELDVSELPEPEVTPA